MFLLLFSFGSLIRVFGSLFISCFRFIISRFFSLSDRFMVKLPATSIQPFLFYKIDNSLSIFDKTYFLFSSSLNQLILFMTITITLISILVTILYAKSKFVDSYKVKNLLMFNYLILIFIFFSWLLLSVSDAVQDLNITQIYSEADISLIAFLVFLCAFLVILVPLHYLLLRLASSYN